MLGSVLVGSTITLKAVALCTGTSLALGLVIALVYRFTNRECSNHFLVALFHPGRAERQLKIVAPEDMDYTTAFQDIFENYTSRCVLEKAKSTHMGSLFALTYRVRLKDPAAEKKMLDAIRCRNGNLAVSLASVMTVKEAL